MVPSASVPVPFKLVPLMGKVVVLSVPAFAIGARFPAGFTITCTVSFAIKPLLSETVNSYLKKPCTSLLTTVVAALAVAMVSDAGPDIFHHFYTLRSSYVSVPVPFKLVVLMGKVIVLSVPAFATGARFAAGFTITCTVSFAVAPLLSVTVNSYL